MTKPKIRRCPQCQTQVEAKRMGCAKCFFQRRKPGLAARVQEYGPKWAEKQIKYKNVSRVVDSAIFAIEKLGALGLKPVLFFSYPARPGKKVMADLIHHFPEQYKEQYMDLFHSMTQAYQFLLAVSTPPDQSQVEEEAVADMEVVAVQATNERQRAMSSLWQQDPPSFSPCLEIDSSSMRRKAPPRPGHAPQHWLKQESADDPDIIKWEAVTSGVTSDPEQDNTPSSAVSNEPRPSFPSAASQPDGLPPEVMLTITKLQCQLEMKQERIAALERQVEDLLQDRKFLRTQIENLTSARSFSGFASSPAADAPKASKALSSEPKPRKREWASSSSSLSYDSGSDVSFSTAMSEASSDNKKRRHHKERRRKGKKGKDYSRKRATGVQYVIHRYKQVLSAFNKKKSMSGAFRHYGIDRNTIANTAPIAELHLAAEETVPLVGVFRPREETLVSYAQKCALVIETDEALARRIEQMKSTGELLPITVKKSRLMHSAHQPLGGASEGVLLIS